MRFKLCAVLLIMGLTGAARAVPITYDINRTVGAGSIIGTITTDGTIGALETANVTGWLFNLDTGTDTVVFDGDENFNVFSLGVLVADAVGLFFDFTLSGQSIFWSDGAGSEYGLSGATPAGGPSEFMLTPSLVGYLVEDQPFAPQQIATARAVVPEPATLALLSLGFGVMTWASRRKRR